MPGYQVRGAELRQLFNAIDPSPFRERDLDPRAEEFIVEWAHDCADLNHIAGAPETNDTQVADGVHVKRVMWHSGSNVEVELVAVGGGGHGIPQPYRRHPRRGAERTSRDLSLASRDSRKDDIQ